MKLSFIKMLLSGAALFFAINAKAQDYVITIKGDSLACKVSIPFMFGSDKYKTAEMSDSKKITTDEIREYYITRKKLLYQSVIESGKTKSEFMVVMERGPISLYQLTYNAPSGTQGSRTVVEWYVSKGIDTVKQLKTNNLFFGKSKQDRKDDFAEMIKDNKAVYDKYIAEDKFSFKQLRNLVHLYNTGQSFKD